MNSMALAGMAVLASVLPQIVMAEATWQAVRRSPTVRAYFERIARGDKDRRAQQGAQAQSRRRIVGGGHDRDDDRRGAIARQATDAMLVDDDRSGPLQSLADIDHRPGHCHAVLEDQFRQFPDLGFLGREQGRDGDEVGVTHHVRLAGEDVDLDRFAGVARLAIRIRQFGGDVFCPGMKGETHQRHRGEN